MKVALQIVKTIAIGNGGTRMTRNGGDLTILMKYVVSHTMVINDKFHKPLKNRSQEVVKKFSLS